MSTPSDAGALPYRQGVGILLLDARNRIFVARRSDTPDAWQMPQGGIHEGEAPAAAAFREMKEEIGTDRAEILAESPGWLTYDLPPHLVGRVWRGRYRGQRQKWFAMRFLGRDDDIDLDGDGHREFDAWRWAAPDDVLSGIVPFKRELYTAVFDAFAPLLTKSRAS